jgi:hypothetical protein
MVEKNHGKQIKKKIRNIKKRNGSLNEIMTSSTTLYTHDDDDDQQFKIRAKMLDQTIISKCII